MSFNMASAPSLRVSSFGDAWQLKTLGDYLSFKNGINAGSELYGSGYKFINVLDIINNDYITHNKIIGKVNIDEKIFEKNRVDFGDILFQRSSEIREESGQSSVYLDEDKSATFGGFVIRGKAKKQYNPVYMNYLLKTWIARKEIVTKAGGSTRFNVGQDSLSKVRIYVTDNEKEQQYIADFLSAVDRKITLLQQKYSLLKQYKKGLMQKLFSQQIRFKDDDGKDFPDWEEDRVDSFVQRVSETVKVEADVTYREIGIRSHGKGIFHKSPIKGEELGNKRVFWVAPGVFVVNIVFAWEHAVALTSEDEKGFIASHRFPMFVPKNDRVDINFFLLFFLSKRGKYLLELASPGGAGRNKTLGQNNFAELKVIFPCLNEQKKIQEFSQVLDKRIELAAQQVELTQIFKKGLLQQMFV